MSDSATIVLLDPGDFTPAYDAALQEGLMACGERPCLIGKVGFDELLPAGKRIDHFYGISGRHGLPRVLKGFEHGFDMLRLLRLLDKLQPRLIHIQWMPLPPLDRLFIGALRRRAPVVVTAHDSNPYNGAANPLMRLGHAAVLRQADG